MKKKKYTGALAVIFLLVVILLIWIFFVSRGGEYIAQQGELSTAGDTQSDIIWLTMNENPNLDGVFLLQEKYGSDIIRYLDCNMIADPEQINICLVEQERYNEFYSRIGWADVFQMTEAEQKAFDCSEIYESEGQKLCEELQKELNK